MQTSLALFDFDGTITKKDSFLEFIKFYRGKLPFFLGLLVLSPLLILMKLKFLRNSKVKEITFGFFFRNEPYQKFTEKCKEFSLKIIPRLIKQNAFLTLETHVKNGDRVVIVSASAENWLQDWCKSMNIELIGTKLQIINGLITGKIDGKNCYGPEKVTRLKQYLNVSEYQQIYAYGDSRGDYELLELAHQKRYQYFK